MSIQIVLQENAENISKIDKTFDLIYADPPFGLQTDFNMTEKDGEVKGFSDKWNSHSDFVDWYAKIVEESYKKLNINGWMYLHNDFKSNAFLLAALPSEISSKFYTNISWKRSGPKNNIKNGWGNIVDSIMVFRKGNPYFEVEYKPLNEKYVKNCFKNEDDRGYYSLAKVTGEKSRPSKQYSYKGYEHPYGYRVSVEKLTELDKKGLLHFGKNTIYKKQYLEQARGVPVQNFWDDVHFISRSEKNKRKYPTQKPTALLERIVRSSCPPDGWVLDPFCGSGTTAVACKGLNRNCMTMDINPRAVEIAKEQLGQVEVAGSLEDFFH